MGEMTSQPAPTRDSGRVPLRMILAMGIVGLAVVDLLVSARVWVIAAALGVIIIAIAFALGASWARRLLSIVLVIVAVGYAFSAVDGGGPFAITNVLIWTALSLGIGYLSGEFSWKRLRLFS